MLPTPLVATVNSRHILWLWRGHKPAYHLRHRRDPERTRCGRRLFSDRWRPMEGTEREARRLGLRLCRACEAAVKPVTARNPSG